MIRENVAAKASGMGASMMGTALTTAKASIVSPIFGIVVLGGVIAFELWKGSKDAKEFATDAKADS